ncbi:MAG: hypothetical protein DRJ42_26710 [Deltaproteobacteria bacterium]|nr:MAG: hypothetical protein DRJ42_26710 [Deltaproteobacteria bacterium]
MTDRATRIMAAVGLTAALLSLVLSAWAAITVSRQEERLRGVAETIERRLVPSGAGVDALPMNSPPPALETEP